MKKNIIYLFLATLAPIFALQSCGLEEPVGAPEGDGYIEFVARPVGYNNQDVHTKSTPTTFENKIENLFFLLFDATTGERISIHTIDPTLTSTPYIKIETKGLSKVKACFLANVPNEFANNIIGTTKPSTASDADNNKYLNSAVLPLSYPDEYTTAGAIGIPLVDLDSNSETDPVACIPMIGISEDTNLTACLNTISITLSRLLAKVTVNLDIDMGTLQTASYYTLVSYKLNNLPNKVALVTPTESSWVRDPNSFKGSIVVGGINANLYNTSDPYTFTFYVPEYVLLEKSNTTDGYGQPAYKPMMFDNETNNKKFPIHLTLNGMYHPINIIGEEKKSMRHLIYLGENASTSFSLKRNVHYTNLLTFKGVTNSSDSDNPETLDHRVIIDETFNAVDVYGQSANCYIINTAGAYNFPAVKGAHKGDLTNLADKYKCTQENAYLKIVSKTSGIEINDLNYNKASAEFSFTLPSATNGNAVVAIAYLDSNNEEQIEWSWHLWFDESAEILNQEVFEIATEKMLDGTTEMMNRNLGSAPNTLQLGVPGMASGGTYYRYGRKEPYFNNGYQGGGVIIGDDLKEETGWSNSKSSTDPCPPGYRIPSTSVWSGDNFNNATREHAEVPIGDSFIGFRYWNSGTTSVINGGLDYLLDDIYYPYSGYIDPSLNHQSTRDNRSVTKTYNANDYGLTNFSKNFDTNLTQVGNIEDAEKLFGYAVTQKRTVQKTEYELTGFSYSLDLEYSKLGYLWGASKMSLFYLSLVNNWKNFQIQACTVKYRQVNQVQRRTRTVERDGWKPKIGDWSEWFDLGSSTNGSWTTSSATKDTELPVVGSIDNTSYRNDLKTHQSLRSFQSSESSVSTFTTDPNEGYQVRCEKE